jgi:hypothetical protein
MRTLETTISE